MRILVFATLRQQLERSEVFVQTDVPITGSELWSALLSEYPSLVRFRHKTRIARNHEFVNEESLLYPEDEVALIPPVSGG